MSAGVRDGALIRLRNRGARRRRDGRRHDSRNYPIDIQRPGDEGCTLIWCGDCYDIPYRSVLPQKVKNLIVAGRCISTTHEAMGAIRVMATCMAMGEAAGRAAKMAVREGVSPVDIDVQKLRDE